jgi:hypothetical protein
MVGVLLQRAEHPHQYVSHKLSYKNTYCATWILWLTKATLPCSCPYHHAIEHQWVNSYGWFVVINFDLRIAVVIESMEKLGIRLPQAAPRPLYRDTIA